MKISNIKTKRNIVSIITIIFSMMMLSGCHKIPIVSSDAKGVETESFLKAVNQDLDPAVIKYEGVRTNVNKKKDETYFSYTFMIQDTKGNLGDEVKDVYDIANNAFKEPEFQEQKTTIYVSTHHFQSGVTNYVVSFSNYDKNDVVYDHVYSIYVSGIDRMTDDYDPTYRYEINDLAYWDSFAKVDQFDNSGYVDYQSEIELNHDNIDKAEQFLMDEYGEFINYDYLTTVTDGVHVPSIEWVIDISSDAVNGSDEYASNPDLKEAIRKSLNEYYSLNRDDEFLNLNITVKITADNYYSTVGSFSNWDSKSRENVGAFKN